MSFRATSSLFCFISAISQSFAAVYYLPDGSRLENPELMQYCATTTKVCKSNFGKNVYATSEPVLDHEWTPLLFPEMYDQFDSKFDCGEGSKFISMDSCAQIHSPMTPYHEEGDLKVKYVESQYTLKWENIRNSKTPIYDSFLDNSVAYWVSDLAKYQAVWKDVGADIVYLKWTVKNSVNNKVYYSMITHNGDAKTGSTLTQYELISDTFSNLEEAGIESRLLESEQRAFIDESIDYNTLANGCSTYPIGVRRSVTNIYDNVEWYKQIFGSIITDEDSQIIYGDYIDYNGNSVKYAHIKLYDSDDSATVSFFQRDNEASTFGEFTIGDFELGLKAVHEENMITPFCGIDRWFDMHYAIDLNDAQASEKVLQSVMQSGLKYTVYGDSTIFLYMPEPNGHSVQVVFGEDSEMEFYTTPQDWDPDWCPMECTDEMSEYSYGDDIATFTWQTSKTRVSKKISSQFALGQEYLYNKFNEWGINENIALIILAFSGILGVALVYYCFGYIYSCVKQSNDSKYQRLQ